MSPIVHIPVEGNAMVKNLFDERIKCNALWAKVEPFEDLEKWAFEAKKVKAYTESIRDVAITAKELAETSLALGEAEKKKAEDILAHLHTIYTKLEASSKQIKEASQTNFGNHKKWINVFG